MGSGATIERAFALARSGQCRTIGELKSRLRQERFDSIDAHLTGKLIKRQLAEAMATAVTER